MDTKTFGSLMLQASRMKDRSEFPDYFTGYTQGLRRFFHGEDFGTQEKYEKWMSMVDNELRRDMGKGYLDGFNGLTPTSDRWEPYPKRLLRVLIKLWRRSL